MYKCADVKKDRKLCKKIREPSRIGEKVLALTESLKKKDAPGNLYKNTTENISFLTVSRHSWLKRLLKFPIKITTIGSQKKEKTR